MDFKEKNKNNWKNKVEVQKEKIQKTFVDNSQEVLKNVDVKFYIFNLFI